MRGPLRPIPIPLLAIILRKPTGWSAHNVPISDMQLWVDCRVIAGQVGNSPYRRSVIILTRPLGRRQAIGRMATPDVM